MILCLLAGAAHAACTSPAGVERDMIYNNDFHTYQFCDGTTWRGVGAITVTTPTAGSGYFVLTQSVWNGNLGGQGGANAKCLTELTTTNTTWKGYVTANANGQLIAGKVHAFLCSNTLTGYPLGGDCNDLEPSTTYYFAYAGDVTKGGATLTTDASRIGPNDNANWADAAHFGVVATRWDDRYYGVDNTTWSTQHWTTGMDCNGWASSSSSDSGDTPTTSATDSNRWIQGTGDTCNHGQRLICYVNP